jgi:hypothetical protein
MKKSPADTAALAAQIRQFLLQSGWTFNRDARGLEFFLAPESLGIKGAYTVALPKNPEMAYARGVVHDAAEVLSQLYGYSDFGQMFGSAVSLVDQDRPSRVTSRFVDESTRAGAMPLASLSLYADGMHQSLYQCAKFRLDSDAKESDLIARRFADDCLFLQTEVGSFIASVEIPPLILRQPDIFGLPSIDSAEVTSALFFALKFINEEVVRSDGPLDDSSMLASVISLFNVELLTALADLILRPEMAAIDFTFSYGNKASETSTGLLTDSRRNRLASFVTFVKEQLTKESSIDVTGAIVELRSRDPAGARNYVKIAADFFGDKTFFSAILDNVQYQRALEAHRTKALVRVVGSGVRLKTHVRVTQLVSIS